jgi:hypothetical protein
MPLTQTFATLVSRRRPDANVGSDEEGRKLLFELEHISVERVRAVDVGRGGLPRTRSEHEIDCI